jgi:hypothetical protein
MISLCFLVEFDIIVAEYIQEGMNMLKLEIALDEQKIVDEGKYEVSSIYKCIDDIFTQNNLLKAEVSENSHFYCDKGKNTDLADMFRCIFYLETQDWFMDYVITWLFYNSYNCTANDEIEVIDIVSKNYPDRKSKKSLKAQNCKL